MSDRRLRELERRYQSTQTPSDGARLLLARLRAGVLQDSQIYTAAYLGDEAAQEALSDCLYDFTGEINDHIVGVCPCGECRWDEGHQIWYRHLLVWGKNLPFKSLDGLTPLQEMLIRIGRGLAGAVWDKLYRPDNSFGGYVVADRTAEGFLKNPCAETRALCRRLWDNPRWGPGWAHQVLYYIVNPGGWSQNAETWFIMSGELLAEPCKECSNRVSFAQTEALEIAGTPLADLPINCDACRGREVYRAAVAAREVVRETLVPWVLTPCR